MRAQSVQACAAAAPSRPGWMRQSASEARLPRPTPTYPRSGMRGDWCLLEYVQTSVHARAQTHPTERQEHWLKTDRQCEQPRAELDVRATTKTKKMTKMTRTTKTKRTTNTRQRDSIGASGQREGRPAAQQLQTRQAARSWQLRRARSTSLPTRRTATIQLPSPPTAAEQSWLRRSHCPR